MRMTVFRPVGYGFRMRLVSKLILVLACVSFLTITLSGFHFHADADTHDEQVPHQHVHSYVAPAELDEDHIDICLFEPATEFSKGEIAALIPVLIGLELLARADAPSVADMPYPIPHRHVRWRPQLRAPPSFI